MRWYILLLTLIPISGLTNFTNAQSSFTKNYVMAYHYCDNTNCGNPMSHTIQLAESNDGVTWSPMSGFTGYQGSVPDPIIRGNQCYIYTPGKVRRYDRPTDTWESTSSNVQIIDANGNIVSYVDPSAYIDQDGLINLFFLNSTGIFGDPAQCPSPPCTRNFDSAIEIPGSNGTQFLLQSGHRISVIVNGNFGPTDPDIFFDGLNYYQYISQGTATLVYRSNTLHGNYTALTTLPNGNQLTNNAGIPAGMYRDTLGLYYSYGHGNIAGQTEIRLATHSNFNAQPAYTAIITASSAGLPSSYSVASPGICENTFLLQQVFNSSLSDLTIKMTPNPVEDFLHLSLPAKGKFELSIYSPAGNCVFSKSISSSTTDYDIPLMNLPSGVYFMHVHTENDAVVKKIIKK